MTNAQVLPKSSFSWQTQLLPEPEQGSETRLRRVEQFATAQSKDAIKPVNGEIGTGMADIIPSV